MLQYGTRKRLVKAFIFGVGFVLTVFNDFDFASAGAKNTIKSAYISNKIAVRFGLIITASDRGSLSGRCCKQ